MGRDVGAGRRPRALVANVAPSLVITLGSRTSRCYLSLRSAGKLPVTSPGRSCRARSARLRSSIVPYGYRPRSTQRGASARDAPSATGWAPDTEAPAAVPEAEGRCGVPEFSPYDTGRVFVSGLRLRLVKRPGSELPKARSKKRAFMVDSPSPPARLDGRQRRGLRCSSPRVGHNTAPCPMSGENPRSMPWRGAQASILSIVSKCLRGLSLAQPCRNSCRSAWR